MTAATMMPTKPNLIGSSSPAVVSPPTTPDSSSGDAGSSNTTTSRSSSPITTATKDTSSASSSKSPKKAATTTRTRRKWKKPKDKPKRPLSAYNLYFKDERERIITGKVPNWTNARGFRAMAQFIAQKWNALDSTSRSYYEARAMEEKKRYFAALAKWKRNKKQQEMMHELIHFQQVDNNNNLDNSMPTTTTSPSRAAMDLLNQHRHHHSSALAAMMYSNGSNALVHPYQANTTTTDLYGSQHGMYKNDNTVNSSVFLGNPTARSFEQDSSFSQQPRHYPPSLEPLPISFDHEPKESNKLANDNDDEISLSSLSCLENDFDSFKDVFDNDESTATTGQQSSSTTTKEHHQNWNPDMRRVLATFDVLGVDDDLMDFMSTMVWK